MEIIKKYRPVFRSGMVLKAEYLQQITKQVYRLTDLEYTNYSNGVITGCEVSVLDNQLIISVGLFCYDREIYMIEQDVLIDYISTNCWMYVKIKHIDNILKNEEQVQIFSIIFDNNIPTKCEIELCRFQLQKGAKLRINYDDFDDMNTEFDTVNIVHVPYSCVDKSTLHPKVLQMFANEFKSYFPSGVLDQVFCLQCINQYMPISLAGIADYLKFRDNTDIEEKTNLNLYKELQRIIGEAKNINKPIEKKAFPKRKIIVD
ncbi:MAG: hypothetical protein R3Y58_10435 [Eubacteriales bacterium]